MLLEIDEVRSGYGGLEILHGVSLSVAEGEVVAVIGANGAGKSTALKTIAGELRPSHGAVRLDGKSVSGLGSHRIAKK